MNNILKDEDNYIKLYENINIGLREYIENEIFPLYNRNEEGHGIEHIKTVIERSLKFAKKYGADLNMAYTIASYHDIGHFIDRKRHEIISAEIFMQDKKIKQWFTVEQIEIIKEAIEDHRASNNHKPRSIYGMIVSTADRTIVDINNTIRRSYLYGKRNYVGLSEEQHIERIYKHLSEKYGRNGYAKIYLEDKEFDEAIERLRIALSNKTEFIERIKNVINNEEGKGIRTKVLFATTNQAKIKKYKDALAERGIELITLKDLDFELKINENGKDAIENAYIKAKTYYDVTKIPTIGMDNNLFIENLSEEKQPGTHVRRVNGKELNDDEMIDYYTNLVKEYGGKVKAKWIYGLVVCSSKGIGKYIWDKENFYFIDKPCKKRNPGYPLDSITIVPEFNKYLVELTECDKKIYKNKENINNIINFIINNI